MDAQTRRHICELVAGLIATDKELVSRKIGEVTTLAIPLGIAVIVVAWVLTAFYVSWANRSYDPEVERLKGLLHR